MNGATSTDTTNATSSTGARQYSWPRLVDALTQPTVLLWLTVAVILFLGAVLRFYRLADFMPWAGDQARDMTLLRQMVDTGQPMLLGSGSSVGSYYRGPAYYYLQLVPFILSDGDPVAAAGLVALFDLGTTLLLFVVGRTLFNQRVGLYAAAFWSVSPLVIAMAQNAWNPNLIAFFAMLVLLALIQMVRGKTHYFCLLVPAWTLAWQMHEQALLMLPAIVLTLIWLRPRIDVRTLAAAISLGALTMAPLLAYDFAHQFMNTRGLISYLLHPAEVSSYGNGFIGTFATKLWNVILRVDSLMPAPGYAHIVWLLLACCGLVGAAMQIRRGSAPERRGPKLFALFLLTPLLYGIWPGNITYPHYMIIIYPLVFFLLALGVDLMVGWLRVAGGAVQYTAAALILLGGADILVQTGARTPQPMTYGATKAVVDHIIANSAGRPFALQLNSQLEGFEGYDRTYMYLFERLGRTPSANNATDTFLVYDPQNLRDGSIWPGDVIDGIKVARLDPGSLGSDLLGGNFAQAGHPDSTGWVMVGGNQWGVVTEDSTQVLVMHAGTASVSMVTPYISPGKSYLVSFDHQNSLSANLWVSAEVTDETGRLLGRFPMGPDSIQPILVKTDEDAFLLPASVDWLTHWSIGYRTDAFRVEMPQRAARLSITFTSRNSEAVKLRDVQLREIRNTGR